jgi:hypothetical protein
MKKVRKFYSSPNGDRWYLIGDTSGEVLCGTRLISRRAAMWPTLRLAPFRAPDVGPNTRSYYA